MQQHGYTGAIYPINPSSTEILGVKAYPSVSQVPDAIDHAFIMIPGTHVLGALKDCADKGIRVETIYHDGLDEDGPERQQQTDPLVKEARKLRIILLGPNRKSNDKDKTG